MDDHSHLLPKRRFPLEGLTERMRDHTEGSKAAALSKPVVVADLVTAILDTMDGRLSPLEATLLKEIEGLGRIIEQTKSDVADVSLDAITGNHIPSATDELDAIVSHTASATNDILESCEMLDALCSSVTPEQAAILQAATTRIYEACSFQDITGQRITKVVAALQTIEGKVLAMVNSSGLLAGIKREGEPVPEPGTLLNGPMLPHAAMGQDDIDKLLADF